MSNGDPDWDVINAVKHMAIIKGQSANMAFNYAMAKETDIENVLKVYEKVFDKIFNLNTKLLNGKETPTVASNKPIPTTTIPPHGSTPVANVSKPKIYKGEPNEVGAAWPSKFKTGVLSCKDKKTDKWSEVAVADMEKTPDGYKFEGMTFIEIPLDKRASDKTPHYRVYKEGED